MENNSGKKGWYWLLIIPFIGTLFPAFYSSVQPTLWGFPFFYWYQILWVFISSILTFIVYKATKDA
ncbi:DUF3311 domain-containing protein [Alicyclobacillus tolerans]|uniref:DUF3311 domain-containing protein n=1 Tax=Alicyclobacillus tolerans TaxID=90970 RepID=UPI001F48FEAD|nr:DUF3311 domain-containing protein [Alicyclobacillus tolerans]MCF8566842.1 DUF3311 domain-containing protein [Alicyclobacillus tolerans]